MNEMELIESKEVRATKLGRIEVLDRVGGLVLLPNCDVATTKQLADYFNVGQQAIKSLVFDNKKELEENGLKVVKGVDIKELKTRVLKHHRSKEFEDVFFRVPSLTIFNRRVILKVAFLLTESDVALKIRNIIAEENPELYAEMSNKDNQLRFKKYEMEIKNYLEFSFGKENVKSQVRVGKYSLDFVIFDNIHIEVDEHGHKNYNVEYESIRQDYILTNTDYYTVRYNPNLEMPYNLLFKIKDIYDNIGFPTQLCN